MKEIKVYRIELENKGDAFIADPCIPYNTDIKEDRAIPRICVAPTIIGCISSLGINNMIERLNVEDVNKGFDIYLYSAMVDTELIHQPSINEVPDVFITGELWVMQPIRMYIDARYRVRRHVLLRNALSRYAFTREFCDEVADHIIYMPIYGNIEAFSYLNFDRIRYNDYDGNLEDTV